MATARPRVGAPRRARRTGNNPEGRKTGRGQIAQRRGERRATVARGALARQEDETASCVAGVLICLLRSKGIEASGHGFRKNNVWNRSDDVTFPGPDDGEVLSFLRAVKCSSQGQNWRKELDYFPIFWRIFSRSLPSGMTNRHLPLLRLSHTAPTVRLSSASAYKCSPLYSTTRARPSFSWQMKSG
jgi:hypothetical protein